MKRFALYGKQYDWRRLLLSFILTSLTAVHKTIVANVSNNTKEVINK